MNLNRLTNFIKNNIFIISTILIAIIFANWQLKSLFEKNNCCPEINRTNLDFFFYPYVSFWLERIIQSYLGNIGTILISQMLIPCATFYLLATIFHRYLNQLWSLTIAFISVISFSDCPFRDFLISLISTKPLATSALMPEITGFPIPSLSVLSFLLSFYYSTQPAELNNKRISSFTAIWSAQIFINAIDAFFGIFLWFSYFFIKIIRRKKILGLKKIAIIFTTQTLIFLAFFTPALILANFSTIDTSNPQNFNITKYFAIYALLPIALTSFLFKIHKIDPYEILYKFWSVYILMFAEFFLIFTAFFFGKGTDIGIVINRIPLFFLHFYYYLPVIFYACREYYPFRIGKDGSKASNIIRKIIFIIFNKLSYIYLPIIISLVILFGIMSALNFTN